MDANPVTRTERSEVAPVIAASAPATHLLVRADDVAAAATGRRDGSARFLAGELDEREPDLHAGSLGAGSTSDSAPAAG